MKGKDINSCGQEKDLRLILYAPQIVVSVNSFGRDGRYPFAFTAVLVLALF